MFGKSASLINIDKLQKRSGKILSVFRETVEGLNTVNAEIDDNISYRDEEIARIESEKVQLNAVKSDNEKVIAKIAKLFE